MSEDVFVGIGGNLVPDGYPDLYTAFQDAIDRLGERADVVTVSPWYVTAPVPVSDQPDFLNAVIHLHTDHSPHQLLDHLLEVEGGFGRIRTVRNAARKLDLDILAFGAQVISDQRLSVPHPRLADRAFVLLPWSDIAPDWCHPVTGRTIAQMASDIRTEGQAIRRYHAADEGRPEGQ